MSRVSRASVTGEHVVQEGADLSPLWKPCAEDQCSGGVVSYLGHLGAFRQEVQHPVAEGRVQTQCTELNELRWYYGVEG